MKIKADFVNVSGDSLKIHFMGNLVSKKFLCCGFDNPYLLVERARLMTAEDLQEKRRLEKEAAKIANKGLFKGRRRKKNRIEAELTEVENAVK